MNTATMTFIPLKRIFVCNVATGRLNDPPKERISAVIVTDRNTVAGFRAKRTSKPKKIIAASPMKRIAITGIKTGIGTMREAVPSSGMRYCSPRAFVAA